jgi:hypothetical protein
MASVDVAYIPQLSDGGEHEPAGLAAHFARIIQDVRDGRRRHFCGFRNVVNRYTHDEFFSFARPNVPNPLGLRGV